MQMNEQVLTALEVLKNFAENDFERHRIEVLINDLTAPPKVEIINDNHQSFLGISFRKRKNGHYYNPCLSIYRLVWIYYFGVVPEGTVIHHKDENKNNNDISNLDVMTPSQHMAVHNNNGLGKTIYKKICSVCGSQYESTVAQSKYCLDCRKKNEREKERLRRKKPETRVCAWCGKEYQTTKGSDSKCCSLSCANRLNYFNKTGKTVATKTKICIFCGKPFEVSTAHNNNNHQRGTCSPECLHQLIATRNKSRAKHKTKICEVCGKEFEPKRRHNETRTCSKECLRKLLNTDEIVTVKCLNCGKEFQDKKSANRKFCSLSCTAKYTNQKKRLKKSSDL